MRRILFLLLLLPVVTVASGATVTVRRDGTGHFMVLHLALSAVADGDTILIGPGEYTETTVSESSGRDLYGKITVPSLTIIGAGMGLTIIGPPMYAPDYASDSPQGITGNGLQENLVISDLTVRNCVIGIALRGGLQIERCHLDNNDHGVFWTAVGSGGTIRDSRFSTADLPTDPIGLYVRGVAGVVVENCEFVSARPLVDNAGAEFRSCVVRGPDVIGFYSTSGTCELWDCEIFDVEVGLQTGFISSRIEIHDSEIQGTYCSLLIDQKTSASIENSILTGGSNSVVFARDAEVITIHACDLVRGAGPVIRSRRPAVWGAVTHDLANNYWGTTDEAQIQNWIIDSTDDPNIYATVMYSPFAGQSVPTEPVSWGELKAFFR